MWIVRLALRRPYTFVVMAILIVIFGAISITTMATDIFPYINIPVVGVIWSYQGMSPDDMAKRVLTVTERAMPSAALVITLFMLVIILHQLGAPFRRR